MNCISFLQSLISLFGISVLPAVMVDHYRKVYLLQCFVKGFKYYEGPKLLDEMHAGAMLELVREKENPYDSNAIAHFLNDQN